MARESRAEFYPEPVVDQNMGPGAITRLVIFIGVLMATFLFAMLLAGLRATLHWPYYAGLAVAAGLLARQQWRIRDRSREHCFAAFRDNNRVGLVIWLGLLLALAIR